MVIWHFISEQVIWLQRSLFGGNNYEHATFTMFSCFGMLDFITISLVLSMIPD